MGEFSEGILSRQWTVVESFPIIIMLVARKGSVCIDESVISICKTELILTSYLRSISVKSVVNTECLSIKNTSLLLVS